MCEGQSAILIQKEQMFCETIEKDEGVCYTEFYDKKRRCLYMDEKLIGRLKLLFDDIIHVSEDGEIEFWYARELQPLLGYARWENFELVI